MSDKAQRIFVDTNILVYAHDISAGRKHMEAKKLISSLWELHRPCLSIQVLQEFFVTVTQKVPRPLDKEHARKIILILSEWKVHIPDVKDVFRATEIQDDHKLSFWDAMIIRSAQQLRCDTLFSEDLSDGRLYDTVRVKNPFASR